MTKRTNRTTIILALLVGSLALTAGLTKGRTAENKLPPPKQQDDTPRAQFFEGKVEELNVEAKWLKIDKKTYYIDDKTKLLNRDEEIKLDDLKVGTQVHGLAKKEDNGNMLAVLVKVGPKPNEGPHSEHPAGPK